MKRATTTKAVTWKAWAGWWFVAAVVSGGIAIAITTWAPSQLWLWTPCVGLMMFGLTVSGITLVSQI